MGRKSILFVDDSSFVRRRFQDALPDDEFDIHSVGDGAEALDWIYCNPPADLVITDLHMPYLDGVGLIDRLRHHADYCRAPIFVLTSGAEGDEKERARAAGATAWIVKPFDREKLMTAIRKVMH